MPLALNWALCGIKWVRFHSLWAQLYRRRGTNGLQPCAGSSHPSISLSSCVRNFLRAQQSDRAFDALQLSLLGSNAAMPLPKIRDVFPSTFFLRYDIRLHPRLPRIFQSSGWNLWKGNVLKRRFSAVGAWQRLMFVRVPCLIRLERLLSVITSAKVALSYRR